MAALIASQGLFLPSYIFPASRCLHEAIQASYVFFARGSELVLQFIAVECSVGFPAAALASLESVPDPELREWSEAITRLRGPWAHGGQSAGYGGTSSRAV